MPVIGTNISLGFMRRLGMLCALAMLAFASVTMAAPADEDFRLLPQTRLRIVVLEWIASTGDYKEWTVLNGEYTVSNAGEISVPLIGTLRAVGSTPSELASDIGNGLKERTGLMQAPDATVQVVAYPPIFVTGHVERPGEYAYTPGLTVLKAVALAGGRARRRDGTGLDVEVDQIRYYGELQKTEIDLPRMQARRARLQAELNDQADIAFPNELLAAQGDVKEILNEEKSIFVARAEAFKRQLDSLDELRILLTNETKVLAEKIASMDRQIKIAQDELNDVSALAQKGTVTRSRESEMERLLAGLQSDRLDLALASMRASQKISETEREATTLKGQRRTEITKDLQSVQADMEQLILKRQNTQAVLIATGAAVLRQSKGAAMDDVPLNFTIIRNSGKEELPSSEAAQLLPGDVLKVDLVAPPAETSSIEPARSVSTE
ncbi:polysaccharide biosynthesis/export family protein [Borborobacter arsenicus]|nr:polysaccharide biosynthesis/export family protein [Pseudaminobacter arsenicus]